MNMFSEHVQSRAERRRATRGHVLGSAERLFRERGYASTTVREIAAEAGVSAGTVMAVGDKSGLLVAVVDSWIAQVHQERAPDGRLQTPTPPHSDAGERIAELVRPFLELFSQDLELTRQYASILASGTHDSVVFSRLGGILKDEIENALVQSGLPPAHAPGASGAVYFAYLGILFASVSGAADVPSALQELRTVVSAVTRSQGE